MELFSVACFMLLVSWLRETGSVCKFIDQRGTNMGQRKHLWVPDRNHVPVVEPKYPWWHQMSLMFHGSMPKGYDFSYLSYQTQPSEHDIISTLITESTLYVTRYQDCRHSLWLAYWEFRYSNYCNNFITSECCGTVSSIARCMYTCILGNWLGLSGTYTVLCKL